MTNKRVKIGRLAAALLAAASLFTLAACNRGEQGSEKVRPEHVFKAEALEVPAGVRNIDQAAVSGDKIYFCGSGYDETTQVYASALYVMNIDGSDLQKLFDMISEQDEENKTYRSRYIQALAVDHSGYLWFYENEQFDDYSDPENPIWEQNSYFKKIDPSGDVLFEINAKEISPESDYFYVNSMAFDSQGNLYITMDTFLYIINNETGKLAAKLDNTEYISGVVSSGSGQVYTMGWGTEGGMVLRQVDTAAGAWGQSHEISNNSIGQMMPGSGEFDFYYQDSTAVYGYKVATGESSEVLNWINSDINSNQMSRVVPLADGRIVALQWREQENDPMLLLMTPRDPADVPEVTLLTYATMWLGSDVRSAIIRFNRSQEEYRIQVRDYYQYSTSENWMGGYEKLNMDIVSGNVPDIINLEGLNIENYINKGLLADIYPFIDNDPELKREDFLQNVLEAASRDGKLYRVIPTFNIYTITAKQSLVGSQPGWTMSDLSALMATKPDAVAFSEMTRGSLLTYSTMMAMDQFINSETGECRFDSDDFIQLLEFANQFEEEIDWEAIYGENYDYEYHMSAYKDDRVLLMPSYVYSVRDIRNYREQFGEDITFIGFPTANRNGTCIMPQMQLSLSAKSKHQEAAWQFLRSFLVEEYYSSSNNYYYGLPLNKAVLERQLELEKTPLADRVDENGVSGGGLIIGRSYSVSTGVSVATSGVMLPGQEDDYQKNYHLTDAEAAQIWDLITSVNMISYSDQEISTILTEEVEYYFNGNKTAFEVAQVVQNKIQTYLNESR